ncbi:hypothetical protein SADUNF_Sadunf10G0155700 [Salix dunnii]|uniref:Uncharacterized protein n=1 Tax=Salix dunnii TaxID=1413687 RepID=A0A835JP05_9ROSI|nr:hypothetical protein SADUNF_Sadunf10G0155700 [Salix dunnii]
MATDIPVIFPDTSSLIQPVFSIYSRILSSLTEPGGISDSIDLSGDGGVVNTILRKAKADALCPSEDLPLVDGMVGELQRLPANQNLLMAVQVPCQISHPKSAGPTVIRDTEVDCPVSLIPQNNPLYQFVHDQSSVITALVQNLVHSCATLIFEVELVACKPRKGSSVTSVSEERARLVELKKQRELVAAAKEEEKKRREEAKAAAAARIQAKLESKKGQGKGKGKAK